MYDYWEKYEMSIAEPTGGASGKRNFQIVLRAYVSVTGDPCSVSIDDISLTPQCTSLPTPDLPPGILNIELNIIH